MDNLKRKIIGISITVALTLFVGWFVWSFFFGDPFILMAISKDAHRYMDEKYNEKIVVDQACFDEIYFEYLVKAHFVSVPDFKFELWAKDRKITGDDIIENYWCYELDTMLGKEIKDVFNCKYDISFGTLCCVRYTGENPYNITELPKFYDCWDDIKGEAGIEIELDKNYIEGISDEEILNFSKVMINKVLTPEKYLNTYWLVFKNGVNVGIDAEKAVDIEYVKSSVVVRGDYGEWEKYYE
jgi:hypothetical protein